MDPALFSRQRLVFLLGVPLAWAVLLLFHPDPGAGDLLLAVGSVAWVVAVIAAAMAWNLVGVPLAASILLGLSARRHDQSGGGTT